MSPAERKNVTGGNKERALDKRKVSHFYKTENLKTCKQKGYLGSLVYFWSLNTFTLKDNYHLYKIKRTLINKISSLPPVTGNYFLIPLENSLSNILSVIKGGEQD